jgi:membrane protein implicated in regulation of membrane protease activity
MNWDELTAVWRKQPKERVPEAAFEVLRKTFEKKSRRLAGALFWRDIREFLAAALVIFVFARAALSRGQAGWPLWISTILVLGVAVFFLKERIRAHRNKTGPNASLLEKIEADIGELRHQRELLLKVGTWYLGPCVLSWFIVMASTRFHGLSGVLRTPVQMGAYFGGSLVLFWLVWKMNQRAVRKKIEPRLADLESLKNGLNSEN